MKHDVNTYPFYEHSSIERMIYPYQPGRMAPAPIPLRSVLDPAPIRPRSA
jgi:hypothetical protein